MSLKIKTQHTASRQHKSALPAPRIGHGLSAFNPYNVLMSSESSAPEGKKETVVVLGATPKEDRYACKAMKMLLEYGHTPVPVNPAFQEVLGIPCHPSIADVAGPIDTVTMYLGEARSTPLIPEILTARPARIIFNPGAENPALAEQARAQGIDVIEACTLVMLRTGQF